MTDNCKHVTKIKTGLELAILSPERWHCSVCFTTESVWACLSCNNVACGRYISEHAMQHFETTDHPLCIEVNEKFVYCYACDDFVLNDNAPGDIKLLRMALDAVADQDFKQLSKQKGSKRILRSHIGDNNKKSRRLIRADDIQTAIVKNRASLISSVLRKWYLNLCKKRHTDESSQKMLEGMKKRKPLCLYSGFTGLRNLGNTCYMNSVLQVLGRTAPFVNFVVTHNLFDVLPTYNRNKRRKLIQEDDIKKNFPTIYVSDRLNNSLANEIGCDSPSSNGLNGGQDSSQLITVDGYSTESSGAVSPVNSGCIFGELQQLFKNLWSGQRAVLSPHSFLYTVWMLLPAFKGYRQQDAEEFLTILLDRMRNELHQIPREMNNQDFITRTFHGNLASRIKCLNCKKITETNEQFSELSLALPSNCQSAEVQECSLQELLELFISETHIEGKVYQCPQCNSSSSINSTQKKGVISSERNTKFVAGDGTMTVYSSATQTLRLTKLPKVLRLHIKRFRWVGKIRDKLSTFVSFPSIISFDSLMNNPDKDSVSPKTCNITDHELKISSNPYQLTGVIVHHGRGFQSGHYTSYCLNDIPEAWIHCNDASVTACSFDEVKQSQAYILFYSELVPSSGKSKVLQKSLDHPSLIGFWPSNPSTPIMPVNSRRVPSIAMTLSSDEEDTNHSTCSSINDPFSIIPNTKSPGPKR